MSPNQIERYQRVSASAICTTITKRCNRCGVPKSVSGGEFRVISPLSRRKSWVCKDCK